MLSTAANNDWIPLRVCYTPSPLNNIGPKNQTLDEVELGLTDGILYSVTDEQPVAPPPSRTSASTNKKSWPRPAPLSLSRSPSLT